MNSLPFQNLLFLTSSGRFPQLILWDFEANSLTKNDCSQFNNIHTLSIEPETMVAAAGTINGLVNIHDLTRVDNEEISLATTLIQGSPVLALCWLDNGLLAVSDKAGRCFIWDIEKKIIVQSLETGRDIICSLAYENKKLYGLSMSKRLFSWDINDQNRFRDTEIPPVPGIGSLVNLVYWPENNTLVFPAEDGSLVFYRIDTGKVTTIRAHAESFYSIFLCGKFLASFGINDRLFKLWSTAAIEPTLVLPVDRTIVSAVCFSDRQDRFLTTDVKGTACEYLLEPQGFKFVRQLPGQDYIICTSISHSEIRQLKEKYQQNRAHEIADRILKNRGPISESDLARYYSELTETGYDHVRLCLEVNQVEQSGDLVRAVELSQELRRIIPGSGRDIYPSMEKHVHLLEKTWNLAEACRVSREILKIDPSNSCAEKIINTYESPDSAGDFWIIEPDISLEVVFKAAAAVGNITGRYVIKTLDRIICENLTLTPELIIRKHEELQNMGNCASSCSMIMENVRFYSSSENKQIQILSFEPDNTFQLVQFAARIIYSDSGTVIIPVILFDCRCYTRKTAGNSDVDIFTIFMGLKNCQEFGMYLRDIHTHFYHTLQRLVTEETAGRKFGYDVQ